jgi:hypothetical protein
VLGFTDNWRGTCELKRPDGTNSGLCKATTTCPPGTNKTDRNGVWGCEAPGRKDVFECPAPPRTPGTGGGGGGGRGPQPPACVQNLKQWEAKLAQRSAELKAAITKDAAVRGPAALEAMEQVAGGSVLLGIATTGLYVEYMPLVVTYLAKCDDVDRSNPVASAECDKAKRDAEYSGQRVGGVLTRFINAEKRADAALGQLLRGGDDPAGKTVKAVQDDLNELQRQIEACLAEVQKWQGPKLNWPFPRF